MSDMTNALESKLLKHALGITGYTTPTTVTLSLWTAITDAEAGTGTEVTGGSGPYARQTITWNAESGGTVTNNGAIEFTGMPACSVVGIAIHETGGSTDTIFMKSTTSKTVNAGDTFRVPDTQLSVQFQ